MSTQKNGLIIRVRPNETPPDDFVDLALKTFSGSWGAAFVKEGRLWIAQKGEALTKKLWEDMRLRTMDLPLTLYLSSAGRSIQPYTVLTRPDGEDEVIEMVAFLDGEFKRLKWEDDTTSTAEILARKYIAPQVQKFFLYSEGDMEKTVEAIREDDNFEGDLMDKITGRGSIVLIDSSGEATTYQKDEKDTLTQDWGTATHHCGYVPPAAENEENEDPQPDEGILGAFASTAKSAAAAVKNAVTPKKKKVVAAESSAAAAIQPSQPDKTHNTSVPKAGEARPTLTTVDGLKKDTATELANAGTKYVKWKPSEGMSRSAAKDKYKTLLGYLPEGWKDFPEVDIPEKVMQEYSKIGGTFRSFSEAGTAFDVQRQQGQHTGMGDKDRTKKPIADVTSVQQKAAAAAVHPDVKGPEVVGGILPILGPSGMKTLKNGELLKTLGTNSDSVPSVEDLKEQIQQFPDLFEQTKLPAHSQSNWDYEDFKKLGELEPQALAILAYNIELERRLMVAHAGEAVAAATGTAVSGGPKKKVKQAA